LLIAKRAVEIREMIMSYPDLSGAGFSGGMIPPGYYNPMSQQMENLGAQIAMAGGFSVPIRVENPRCSIEIAAPKECNEFTWLRNRIDEVLWK
jgi:hypothetical protein